jgi:UDP-N-acetylglucosamine diphosphorylase / glucose-1-phosphate thymidylyltransferase / UDP-N-acetylgalactosamine diphosphorylase / glucosamine-1-phosphate N-acetyltransferase / galactosamine-1-phosphate N-acetyltransferase
MKIEQIILFEQDDAEWLYPFSVMHCSWEIRCGCLKLFEKVQMDFPDCNVLYSSTRKKHLASFLKRYGIDEQKVEKKNTLSFFAHIIPDKELWYKMQEKYNDLFQDQEKAVIFVGSGLPFACFIPSSEMINPQDSDIDFFPKFITDFGNRFDRIDVGEINIIRYLWDAIFLNSKAIRDDARFYKFDESSKYFTDPNSYFVNPGDISIGGNVKISPSVVIDAQEGPVIIGNNVKIMPQATIIGPCFIGDNSVVKIGAKIYEDTSIGEVCKVGGEIESTIIHAYSNKQHDGFLGHSYIGEWVNLGADTNNSDLKNTYGDISVFIRDKEINTGSMFMGLLCGDHSKSAINTAFNTGTVAGICGIFVHEGFLARNIPSYAWTGRKNSPIYKIDKAIEVAKKVMSRRNKQLLPEEIELMKLEYERVHNQ